MESEGEVEKVKDEVGYVGARLREPSTYNGLGHLIAAAVVFKIVSATGGAEIVKDLAAIGLALGGIIGVFVPDPGSKKKAG